MSLHFVKRLSELELHSGRGCGDAGVAMGHSEEGKVDCRHGFSSSLSVGASSLARQEGRRALHAEGEDTPKELRTLGKWGGGHR